MNTDETCGSMSEPREIRRESYEWGVAHGRTETANELYERFGTSSVAKVAEQFAQLEAIVRDLANATPLGWRLSRYQLPDEGTLECVHCGASNLEAHRPGCLFWRAVQWRDAHPAE